MKLINRKHTGTKQKRANMQYITHIYLPASYYNREFLFSGNRIFPALFI